MGHAPTAVDRARTILEAPPRPEPVWKARADAFLEALGERADRLSLINAYKPLSVDAIVRWRVVVGPLPAARCKHDRILFPVTDGDEMAALRGRRIACDCPQKVLMAAGSRKALFNIDGLREGRAEGKILYIVENPFDAMWGMDRAPEFVIVALGGVGWSDEWTELVARAKVARAVVALDNDLAGQAVGRTLSRLLRERQEAFAARGMVAPPVRQMGPAIARSLAKARVPVSLFRWEGAAAHKTDFGELLAADEIIRRGR